MSRARLEVFAREGELPKMFPIAKETALPADRVARDWIPPGQFPLGNAKNRAAARAVLDSGKKDVRYVQINSALRSSPGQSGLGAKTAEASETVEGSLGRCKVVWGLLKPKGYEYRRGLAHGWTSRFDRGHWFGSLPSDGQRGIPSTDFPVLTIL